MEQVQDLSFQIDVFENTHVDSHNTQEPSSKEKMQANEYIFQSIFSNR